MRSVLRSGIVVGKGGVVLRGLLFKVEALKRREREPGGIPIVGRIFVKGIILGGLFVSGNVVGEMDVHGVF